MAVNHVESKEQKPKKSWADDESEGESTPVAKSSTPKRTPIRASVEFEHERSPTKTPKEGKRQERRGTRAIMELSNPLSRAREPTEHDSAQSMRRKPTSSSRSDGDKWTHDGFEQMISEVNFCGDRIATLIILFVA